MCERAFSHHIRETRHLRCPDGHRRACPRPDHEDLPYFLCNKCILESDPGTQCPHYHVEESYILRTFNCDMSGMPNANFDVSKEKGRIQLKKFLGFIESIANTN